MNFTDLVSQAKDKSNFLSIRDYLDFTISFLGARSTFIVAEIVCQNEQDYRFWQLPSDAGFAISRPFNSTLFCSADEVASFKSSLFPLMTDQDRVRGFSEREREMLNKVIYTVQQCIGIALDGVTGSNFARKLNGDLFERHMQLWFRHMGVDCTSATVRVPVEVDGIEQCKMNFQHDLIMRDADAVKIIGSVKTSSKDRLGKVFVDKMLLSSLTGKSVPHIAIFLNDVQRGAKTPRSYRVSSTFLPGHFKAYTIKLNPLDGVYYCDLRPNMLTDPLLSGQISRIDNLICNELWEFLEREPEVPLEVAVNDGLS